MSQSFASQSFATEQQVANADVVELTRQAEASNAALASTLERLATELDAASRVGTDADFAVFVKLSRQLLDLDDLEISRLLNVSRPTIGRWTRGVSFPHSLTRTAIYGVLAKKARSQAKSRRS